MKRLEKLPQYIDDSRQKLRQPVKLFIEHELETLSRLPSFFNQIKSVSFDHLPPTPQRQLHRLIENVQNALQKYEDWLIIDVLPECHQGWPIGEEVLRGLLAKRGISESPATLLRHAEDEVERCRERLKDLGRTIKRKALIEDLRDGFKQQHPDNIDGCCASCATRSASSSSSSTARSSRRCRTTSSSSSSRRRPSCATTTRCTSTSPTASSSRRRPSARAITSSRPATATATSSRSTTPRPRRSGP